MGRPTPLLFKKSDPLEPWCYAFLGLQHVRSCDDGGAAVRACASDSLVEAWILTLLSPC